jgi:hypothetical protein
MKKDHNPKHTENTGQNEKTKPTDNRYTGKERFST